MMELVLNVRPRFPVQAKVRYITMVRAAQRKAGLLLGGLLLVCAQVPAQQAGVTRLESSGQIILRGRPTPFLIRHLPVNSFPDLPTAVQDQLRQRGCLIPQTYQAYGPENVVHARLEGPGTSDWAVLCSAHGTVSLLVFFGSAPGHPHLLATAQESERLQPRDPGGVLGFNWGIDAAAPQRIHEAQSGLKERPPWLDHDALADSLLDRHTVYHFYSGGAWTLLNVPDN
jgi:hypothetical protein